MGALYDKDFILHSPYNPEESQIYSNLVDCLLKKADENASNGRDKWITNSQTDETTKYSTLESNSAKIAAYLHQHGMKSGDVALYLTSDITKIFEVAIGVWRLGGCLYSSYPEDTEDTLLMRLQESSSKFIFCDPMSVQKCEEASNKVSWPVEIIVFGSSEAHTTIEKLYTHSYKFEQPKHTPKLDDPALILCTSGTTGKSKGAVYTHGTILGFCMGTNGLPKNNPRPSLWLLRCTHVLGILYPIRNIFVGDWSIMMPQVTKANIFYAVNTYKPFIVFGFPTYLLSLVEDPSAESIDRSTIQLIATGGLVIKKPFYDTMMKLPSIKYVINGYGMTECAAITTTVDISGNVNEIKALEKIPPLSVGKLYPNTKLKVLSLDEPGKLLGPGVIGELCVKSPILCSRYWNRADETKSTFSADGWMKTGDLGYYDNDGFVFVTGRMKETFKYFNNHISPEELEEVILQHGSVSEACVFGILDEAGGGHIPKALVVLKSNVDVSNKEVIAEKIKKFANEKVASYKQLRGGLFIVDSLPKGKTGKVLRNEAAKMVV